MAEQKTKPTTASVDAFLYIKKFDDVDLKVLEDLVRNCVTYLKQQFG